VSILAITGSPSATSRTTLFVKRLNLPDVEYIHARDVPAEALLGTNPNHPAILTVAAAIANASAVVVATPVYKAAYSGLLKTLLDLLPQFAFAGKVVLPLASGGSIANVLAIDYALRPVLSSMGATHIVPGFFALESFIGMDGEILDEGAA
jgi:FMN reductase